MLVDSTDFTFVPVACPGCGCPQAGKVHGSYTITHEEQDGRQYFLVSCPVCSNPFLAYVDWAYAGDGKFVVDPFGTLFPDSGDHFDVAVPKEISISFREAIRTLGAGAPTATAVMCRRTLQLICKDVVGPALEAKQAEEAEARKDKGGKPKKPWQPTLSQMLNALKEKIDPRLHEWADTVVRELGNNAAHDSAIEKAAVERGEVVLGGCLLSECDPAWFCTGCGHRFGNREKPNKPVPARTTDEWIELIKTMLPQPVMTNEIGELLGGDPALVIVRVTSNEIAIMEAGWDWVGSHRAVQKGEPFAKTPLRTPSTRVAELIMMAGSKRLSRHRWCPRCHHSTEPEMMHEAICHGCAERLLGVVH